MSNDIRIKKGLDIKLIGQAEEIIEEAVPSNIYAINLSDFHSITPKMLLKVDDKVKAGQALFFNKSNEDMLFVSPVSGIITEIERGARRKIVAIISEFKQTRSRYMQIKVLLTLKVLPQKVLRNIC